MDLIKCFFFQEKGGRQYAKATFLVFKFLRLQRNVILTMATDSFRR